jgi:hypothetical protein
MGIRPYVKSPDWSEGHHRGAAKCRGLLYDEKGNDLFFDDTELAMSVCNGTLDGTVCPRRTECLRVAMLNRENFGVWGGMTPHQRLRLRMRYPGMPERWTWRPEPQEQPVEISDEGEEAEWPAAA